MAAPPASHFDAVARFVRRHDGAFYALWAAIGTLASARMFYGYMLRQTGGEWSAPLDDVFIHFDYARSTALGHPFEWTAGNGYSSGNTSLSYPLVLALGYAAGWRAERLMVWAALVAAVSVFGALLGMRRLFFRRDDGGPELASTHDRWSVAASYLAPPVVLGLGALDWSLWSGMEVALLLGVWALALAAYLRLESAPRRELPRHAWMLGIAGALLVFTRPEASVCVAVFGLAAAWARRRSLGPRKLLRLLVAAGLPSALLIVAQALVNRELTGEWSANGAIVKLAVNSPFMSTDEKVADYVFNLRYSVLRNVEYHFADKPVWGVVLPALALAALTVRRTRFVAVLLWAQIAGWLLLTAFNGQVRWQNERYTMPAVAWMLLLAALGASALTRPRERPNALLGIGVGALVAQGIATALRPGGTNPELRLSWLTAFAFGALAIVPLFFWPVRSLAVIAALVLAQQHQAPKMRDQKWFFGRASRNIRDQHTTAGRHIATLHPNRLLVGDAGALIYASNLRGLDIIGLGGYGKLPFARAGVHGLPATLELLERIPPRERPELMAIYPTWWGTLPTWFSDGVVARFPVFGNVICGGYEKVVYHADWHLLGTGRRPRTIPNGDELRDDVDVADLVSEREHRYQLPAHGGFTEMKILGDIGSRRDDVFDAGRRIGAQETEHFVLHGLRRGERAHLIFRTAPESKTTVRVQVGGHELGPMELVHEDRWVEPLLELPAELVDDPLAVTVTNDGPGEFIDYHAWATQ